MALQAASERADSPARIAHAKEAVRRALRSRWAPRLALCLLVIFSIAAKSIDLSQPCSAPCSAHSRHTLIFDEKYYVNAARVIDGIEPPKGAPYRGAPKGMDPNAEHPQLAKLVIAGGMEIFGDTPLGWRSGSILFAAIAMLALYALVRGAGGGAWLAVGSVAVMSLDNLMLVHGRIGTLDIYAVAMMLVSAALYVRKRPLLAGLMLGVAACMKEVSLSLAFVFVLLELLMLARTWRFDGRERLRGALRERGARLGLCLLAGSAGTLGLLWLLDVLVPAYDPGTKAVYAGNPIAHLEHMYNYALLLTSKPGETGIASDPLSWLLNEKPINYARVTVNTLVGGKIVGTHYPYRFEGEMNPFIIFLAIPATFAAIAAAWRKADGVAALGASWCLGTYLPFLIGNAVSNRISYLYYMVIVMPGLYIVTAKLFSGKRMPKAATVGWALALIYGFVHLYPIRTLL